MNRYVVTCVCRVSGAEFFASVAIEAETPEQAKAIAESYESVVSTGAVFLDG